MSFASFSSDLDYILKHDKDRDTARPQHRPTYTDEEKVRLAGLAPPNGHNELLQLVDSFSKKTEAALQAVHDKGNDALDYLYHGGSYTDASDTLNVSADGGDNSGAVYLLNKAMTDGFADVEHVKQWASSELKTFGDRHTHMRHDLLLAAEEIAKNYTATTNDIAATLAPEISKASLWQPKSATGGGFGAWLKKAVQSVGHFFKGIAQALSAAFHAFMVAADAALKAVMATIDKAVLAALPGHAQKYTQGLKAKEIKRALATAHATHPNEISLLRNFAVSRSKHPPVAVQSAMKTLATHFDPQRKMMAAHIKSADPSTAVDTPCALTLAWEADASYFVGFGLCYGVEIGLTPSPEVFFEMGGSFGVQAGANTNLDIGFVVGPESNFKGFTGSVVLSASDDASVIFRVSFSLSPFEFQGISMGIGVGAGLAAAGEVSYTWVGDG
jgi:hypothetical protein